MTLPADGEYTTHPKYDGTDAGDGRSAAVVVKFEGHATGGPRRQPRVRSRSVSSGTRRKGVGGYHLPGNGKSYPVYLVGIGCGKAFTDGNDGWWRWFTFTRPWRDA